MTAAGIEGFLLGGLVGLLFRPVLDSYLRWRLVRSLRAERSPIPTYPFLNEEEENDAWPM